MIAKFIFVPFQFELLCVEHSVTALQIKKQMQIQIQIQKIQIQWMPNLVAVRGTLSHGIAMLRCVYRQTLWIRPNQKIQYKEDTNIVQTQIQIWTETNTNTGKISEYDLIRKYNTRKIQIFYK